MIINTSVLVIFGLLVVVVSATNYCNLALCDANEIHIGCNNNNTFYSTCNTPVLVNFSITLQSLVLTTHNNYRNKIASGSTQFASAARMPPLRWNTELALLAEYNVRQCAMKHDQCRNTDSFPYAGQNLGYISTTGTLTDSIIQSYIKKIQDNWYAENNSTTQAWLVSYPQNTNGIVIGHFTAMIQDHGTDIGCATATYKKMSGSSTYNYVLLACDYSFTNIYDFPVYANGTTAVQCKTGRDTTYTSLCSMNEVVSPNP